MHKGIFSVYDVKSAIYGNPFYSSNLLTALRDFQTAASDPSSTISKYPADFQLFELGSFDDVLGQITLTQMVNHGPASQFFVKGDSE